MNRKKYRQIWMILLLLLGGGSYFLFIEGQELNEKIGYAEGAFEVLRPPVTFLTPIEQVLKKPLGSPLPQYPLDFTRGGRFLT